jgi:hypothetical protein
VLARFWFHVGSRSSVSQDVPVVFILNRRSQAKPGAAS